MTYGGGKSSALHEVSALVLDIGTSTTRAGYAGDDTPRTVFSTTYGYVKESEPLADPGAPSNARLFIGDHVTEWRANMEVANPMKDGIIKDFTAVPSIISHAFVTKMDCSPAEHPVMVTEAPWNTPENRQRMAEILFEEFKVPAFYIANNAVLSSFASGKGTSLVIDVGKSMVSVTPISDGFVLRKGMSCSALPPQVQSTAFRILTTPSNHPIYPRPPIQLLPYQLIASKKAVEIGRPHQAIFREDRISQATESWRQWAEAREAEEWIAAANAVIESGWTEVAAHARPPRHYEFPTGYNAMFAQDRFIPGEMYFKPPAQTNPNVPRAPTIPEMITTTMQSVEPDLRAALLNHVVLTGAGSMMQGMSDRIFNELQQLFPAQKIKMHAPGNPTERKYAGWLGGSILASLGTFHQLWVSAEEWQEHGASIVMQRCK
ncbi:brg1-associated factor b [Cantharellus anzutake]|uniref:brg1-associated factor b n=1 Tax=Cantharellus anzutake TaxID=1750568 RepID=UPI0019058B3A|nr:brg1-associated factor b [Cantharellus anzutake]KAF8341998.1 brg1-associated factor b [Cantharellus anzutake]